MIRCHSCGRNSRTDDVCEWCRQPSRPVAPVIMPTPPIAPATRRVALTGEVVEVAPMPQPTLQIPPQPTLQMPYPHANPGQHAAYQTPPRTAPFAGGMAAALPAGAYSAAAIQAGAAADGPTAGERWEKALAISLPIVALSMLLIHFAPAALVAVLFGNLFVLPIVLGATGAIPRYEEAITDCAIMLGVTFLLGPVVALVAYLVTAAVKQECNGAVVSILVLTLLVKALFGIAFAPAADTIALVAMWGLLGFMSFFMVCASFLGWLISSFFRNVGD